jgi:hypothetical protein
LNASLRSLRNFPLRSFHSSMSLQSWLNRM